jgi:hypothetical protein
MLNIETAYDRVRAGVERQVEISNNGTTYMHESCGVEMQALQVEATLLLAEEVALLRRVLREHE